MGKNTPFESEAKENRDLVRTAMRIEELSDQVVEVTEFFQMNKLRLEDVTRERDQLAAYKRAAESRREISKNWNDQVGDSCSWGTSCNRFFVRNFCIGWGY